ncbi:hypothetical protein GPX89_10260 [Nocardia sp. ET3-3]|uniref:PH domain-containing protein n=1 Tax=Nocardia terrae TaxID=2675851 RepID=A0A7K1UTM0_9NOCA|nr:hypothetical protein [Nocardia terrae]
MFVLIGLRMALTGEASAIFVGALAVFFFAAVGVIMVKQLFRRTPELIITDSGFTHRRLGAIDWSEVEGVGIAHIGGHPFVDVLLRDPAAYLARASRRTRLLGRTNHGFGYSPAVFSTQTLPVSANEVLAAMRRHSPTLELRSGSTG